MFRVFVYTNAWVALAAAMQTMETYYLVDTPPDLSYLFFILFSTISLYALQRISLKPIVLSHGLSERQEWQIKNKGVLTGLFLTGGVISLLLLFTLDSLSILLVIIAAGLSVSYSAGIPFFTNLKLREIPGLKIFLLTSVWVLVTQIIPLLQNDQGLEDHSLRILTRFLFIFSICIPFDIRDMYYDHRSMKTIPQLIGHKGAVVLGIILLTITCLLYQFFLAPIRLYAMSFTCFIAMLVLIGTMKKRSELYYSGLAESILIMQAVFVILADTLFY